MGEYQNFDREKILEVVLSLICLDHARLVGHRLMPRTRLNYAAPDAVRKKALEVMWKHAWTPENMDKMMPLSKLTKNQSEYRRLNILVMVEEIHKELQEM